MKKKSELPALILSLLVTVALVGAGGWWLKGQLSGSETPPQPEVETKISESILPVEASESKQKGIQALADADYTTAQLQLNAGLEADKNDPEARIYLNNAEIADAEAYTLAMVVPASKEINPSLAIMRGVAQAQGDINQAGGVNGVPVKLILRNDDGNTDQARTIAAELVADPSVLGVIGHFSSDVTLAASEVYESGQLPMVSPTSTAVDISNAGEYIFRTVPSDRLAAGTLARYVRNQLNQQKVAIFYTGDSAFSRSVRREFATELLSAGGTVAGEFDINAPGFSAGSAVQEAKEKGAKVLMLALTTQTIETANLIASVNAQELPLIGSDGLYSPRLLDEVRGNAVGLTLAVPWHILSHENAPFVSESRQLWGGDVNWRTAMAYDATMSLAAGLAASASREGIAAALSTPGFSTEGATDSVSFFDNGDRNQSSQLVTVAEGTRAGSGYDFIPAQ